MVDSHGRAVAWLHVWRVPVRRVHLHRPESGQCPLSRILTLFPPKKGGAEEDRSREGTAHGVDGEPQEDAVLDHGAGSVLVDSSRFRRVCVFFFLASISSG